MLEILVLAWESHTNVAWLNMLMGSQVPNLHLENKIFYGNKKNLHRFTSTPKDHIQSQK